MKCVLREKRLWSGVMITAIAMFVVSGAAWCISFVWPIAWWSTSSIRCWPEPTIPVLAIQIDPDCIRTHYCHSNYPFRPSLSIDKWSLCGVSLVRRNGMATCYQVGIPHWLVTGSFVGMLMLGTWMRRKASNAECPVEHCGRCGYCLKGNVSKVCPECGTPIDAKQLARLPGVNSVSTNPVDERNTTDE